MTEDRIATRPRVAGTPPAVPSRAGGGVPLRVLAFTARIVAAAYLATLAGLVWWATVPLAAHWQPRVVVTDSMQPSVAPGDVVLIGPARPGPRSLPPGRVILVRDEHRSTGTYFHRVARYDADGRIVTRGDANRQEDYPSVRPDQVIGEMRLLVPAVGRPVVWAHRHRAVPLAAVVVITWLAATVLLWSPGHRPARQAAVRPAGLRRRAGAGAVAVLAVVSVLASWGATSAGFTAFTTNVGNSFVAGTWAGATTTGELQWWGSGGYAQNAVDTTSRWTAAAESSGATTWAQVAAGNDHTCAVRTGGTLWCWGHNDHGQLGLGDTTDRSAPTQVGAATTWTSVSAGGFHTCAIQTITTTSHTLYCWGMNSVGQVGNGNTTDQTSPVLISGSWLLVAAGTTHTCAATLPSAGATAGAGWCWGGNRNGQLGNGSAVTTATSTPDGVFGSNTWMSIAAGTQHGCGVNSSHQLYCWGEGMFGQNGDSGWAKSVKPAQIGSDTDWSVVVAGAHHTCALKSTGTLWCLGLNTAGQLGQNDTTTRYAITQVGTGTWTAVSAGGNTTCARAGGASPVGTAGTVWCWGLNAFGKYGVGDATDRLAPSQAAAGTWSSVAVGPNHACFITGGALSCAGDDNWGQLGRNATVVDRARSGTAVPTTINWSTIVPGRTSVCGIDTAAALYCWGANGSGQVGLGTTTTTTTPTRVGSATWTAVSVGGTQACGIQTGGTLWCWGDNSRGQLGVGSTTSYSSPQAVAVPAGQAGGTTWSVVRTGRTHTCGILSNGTLWCWGGNTSGQLGVADSTDRTSPTQVSAGVTTWSLLALGAQHTCATRGNPGTLWCWGSQLRGQLGSGSLDNSSTQTAIKNVPFNTDSNATWTAVTAGDWHSCALQTGTLSCWGDDSRGEVGTDLGVTIVQKVPLTIAAPAGTWSSVSAGAMHTCAQTSTRATYCWGYNDVGQLGTDTSGEAFTPTLAATPPTSMALAAGGGATFVLIGNYAGAVTADSPSGYWRLGEASGTTIKAFTGTPNGTTGGSPTLGAPGAISGDPDTAITFAAASSQKVAFTDVDDFDARSSFSVEFWIKPTAGATANRQFAVAKERYTADNDRGGWAVLLSSTSDPTGVAGNRLVFGRYSGTGGDELAGTTTLSAGTWYHVAATYDGTTMRLYVNGALENSVASSRNVENTTSVLNLGVLQTTGYLSATLDDVALYGAELPSTRVSAHYAARTA